jgi:DNA-binding MarR family transcriptional regulator
MSKAEKIAQFIKEQKQPEYYPGYLLWQASNIWYRNIKNILKKSDATFTQFVILASLIHLSNNKDHINQKQIAKHAKLDIMMTSDVLKKLELKKLVIRYPNPKDKRHNSIKITPKGFNLIMKTFPQVNKADIKFFKILDDDVKSFTGKLEKLIRTNFDSIYTIDAD